MKRTKKTVGKRFSRRDIEVITVGDLVFHLEQIDWDEAFTASTIDKYRAKALDALKAEGVPIEPLLEQSPHGSLLRDYVLNNESMPHDSLASLAARMLEICLHVVAYQGMPEANRKVAGLAFKLGRLSTLFDVYEIDRRDHAKRRADKPADDPYDTTRNSRVRAYHARLIEVGARDANQQTADEFGLSARQVSRIVKPRRT